MDSKYVHNKPVLKLMDSKYVHNKPIQLQSTKYLATLPNEKKRPKRQYCGQGFYYDNRYQRYMD